MKLRLFILALGIISPPLYAAFDYPALSARHAGLSGSYIASTAGRDGFMLNPALSVYAGEWYASLSYAQLYNVPELRYGNGAMAFPYRAWGLGVGVDYFGGSLYSEMRVTINGARKFLDGHFAIGVSVHAYQISARNYESRSAWGISVGVQYQPIANLHVAGAIENLNRPTIGGAEELPQTVRLGLQYQPVTALRAHVAVQKDSWFPPELALGVEYHLSEALSFQSGYSTRADVPSGGLLLAVGRVEIGYALQYHFDLGETHFFSVAFHK